MFRSGTFVAEHVTATDDQQVQPNGVDLTVDAVFEPTEPGRIERDGKHVAGRDEVATQDGYYRLEPNGYIARYGERIAIPDDHIGFVYPRSSLMRNGAMLTTAVWDAGYEGRGEGLLQVHRPIDIEPGARIAQLVFARAEHTGHYDGSYQGENV
jgi:deoxycytidine triphosphate deaminase